MPGLKIKLKRVSQALRGAKLPCSAGFSPPQQPHCCHPAAADAGFANADVDCFCCRPDDAAAADTAAVTANFQNSLSKQTRAGWPALRGLLIPAVRCAAPWAVTVSDARAACPLVQTNKKKRTQTHLIDSGATEVNRQELKRYVEEHRIRHGRQITTSRKSQSCPSLLFVSSCCCLLNLLVSLRLFWLRGTAPLGGHARRPSLEHERP